MQAIYLLDQTVNIHTAPNAWRDKCQPVLDAAGDVADWIIPKGTIIDGDEALLRVATGQCAPLDEECAVACGRSTAQLESTQRKYLAAERGIKGVKDTELFMAGIIEGYAEGTTDDKPVYLPGPNYAAWESKRAERSATKGNI
jgi:hypothetical protein